MGKVEETAGRVFHSPKMEARGQPRQAEVCSSLGTASKQTVK